MYELKVLFDEIKKEKRSRVIQSKMLVSLATCHAVFNVKSKVQDRKYVLRMVPVKIVTEDQWNDQPVSLRVNILIQNS